jgi:RNA polymerase sigma factor (TIGR02999 family)
MRRIVVDRARARKALKRGRGLKVTLDAGLLAARPADVEAEAVNDALDELARLNEREARLVELRYFGGLSLEEAADALGISRATVYRVWAHAKAWLYRRLAGT